MGIDQFVKDKRIHVNPPAKRRKKTHKHRKATSRPQQRHALSLPPIHIPFVKQDVKIEVKTEPTTGHRIEPQINPYVVRKPSSPKIKLEPNSPPIKVASKSDSESWTIPRPRFWSG